MVSDLFTSLVVKNPVYNVSIPILRDDGEVRFVMSLGLLPDDLYALLASRSLQPHWTTAIWDGKGVILARSHDHARLVGTAIPPRLRMHAPFTVFRTTGIDGDEVLAAVGRVTLADWGISATFPAALADRQVSASLWLWGATIVVVGTLVVALALLFGRELTRPLAAATAAAGALGRGEPFVIDDTRLSEANAVNAALRRARDDVERSTAALRESEEQLRTAAEAAQFGAHQYDVANDRAQRSPQIRQILGADDCDEVSTFESGLAFVHPDDRDRTRLRKQQIIAGAEGRYELEYRIRRPDGQVRWVMDRGQVIREPGRKQAAKIVGVLLDITELKAAEQRQRLLFDELNHRVKNTLSIVQSLAQQTLRTRPDPQEFARAFEDWLQSLARPPSLDARLLAGRAARRDRRRRAGAFPRRQLPDPHRRRSRDGCGRHDHHAEPDAARTGDQCREVRCPVGFGRADVDPLGRRGSRRIACRRPALAGRERPAGVAGAAQGLRLPPAGGERVAAQRPVRPRLRAERLALPRSLHRAAPARLSLVSCRTRRIHMRLRTSRPAS
jgi:PAS domain S-box-containing protein